MNSLETLQPLRPDRAEQQVGPRNSPLKKSIFLGPEVVDLPDGDIPEELVDAVLTSIFEKLPGQKDVDFLAREALSEYNDLSKGSIRERKSANDLVMKTASELLQNPQNISIAENVWRANDWAQNGVQEPKEPFSKKVKEKMHTLIKDEWEDITPEQIAGLVRMYANKDEYQESSRKFAEELLTNYFKGPKGRNQRIGAYYNFVSGALDLADDEDAFKEGMKIVLHGTDILPKDPSLTEQAVLLSLSHNEDPDSFRMALVANYVIEQLRFMGLQDLERYYEDRIYFVETDRVQGKLSRKVERVTSEVKRELEKKHRKVTDNEAIDFVDRINDKMLLFFSKIRSVSLSEERKHELMSTWPFDLAFDENDPLNQKFNKVFSVSPDTLRT